MRRDQCGGRRGGLLLNGGQNGFDLFRARDANGKERTSKMGGASSGEEEL